jgi:hypothetical protein
LAAAAVLGGCGGQSDEERAQQRRDRALTAWDDREGTAWTAYEKAWSDAWRDGCSAVEGKLESKPPPPAGLLSDCDYPRGPDDDFVYEAPFYPPNSPQEQGREDGFEQGCADEYDQLRDKSLPQISALR